MILRNGKVKFLPNPKLQEKADPKCEKCFGRGHIHINIDTHVYTPCKCTRKERAKKCISLDQDHS